MKKYIFKNGEIRLESHIREGHDFKTACILWGCFDRETGDPLPFEVAEATSEDIHDDEKRREEISEERAAVEYDDSMDFYICPNTGFMMSLEGDVIDDNDCNEQLNG